MSAFWLRLSIPAVVYEQWFRAPRAAACLRSVVECCCPAVYLLLHLVLGNVCTRSAVTVFAALCKIRLAHAWLRCGRKKRTVS